MVTTLTASELWDRLQFEAGLEIRLKSGRNGRDMDFEDAVIADLESQGLTISTGKTSLGQLLKFDAKAKSPRISTERLLIAILNSQRGFAAMMDDILQTLISANATRGENEMRFGFTFSDPRNPVSQTLQHFREEQQQVRRVLESRFYPASSSQLWSIWSQLTGISSNIVLTVAHEVRVNSFPLPPILAGTQYADVDSKLKTLMRFVGELRHWCRSYASTRNEFLDKTAVIRTSPHVDAEEIERVENWSGAVSDYWDGSVVEAICKIEAGINAGKLDPGTVDADLKKVLEHLPMRETWVEQTFNQLLDILRLPTWRKRHELYSVWVGSVLLNTARQNAASFQFHTTRSTLSFTFGGSRLASYEYDGSHYDIWAELRSELVGRSAKRTRGIQPDFRIVRVALDNKIGKNTHFVLECKHYLKPSVLNFTLAATDYARSCPNADTFIVNHGVADHDLLVDAVPEALSPRIKFIGKVTAERERLSPALKQNIEQVLFPPAAPDVRFTESAGSVTVPQAEPSATENACDPKELACRITLDWDQSLYDMDLSIEAIDSRGVIRYVVSYRDKGSLIQEPFAYLQEDVRSGPGKEILELSALHFPRYRIIVHNHSKLGEFSTSNISCRVTMNGVECSVMRPVPNGGYEWVVGFIDASGRLPLIETYPDITSTTSDLALPAVEFLGALGH